MAQEGGFGGEKLALAGFGAQTAVCQEGQDLAEVSYVLLQSTGVHQNVIHEVGCEPFALL